MAVSPEPLETAFFYAGVCPPFAREKKHMSSSAVKPSFRSVDCHVPEPNLKNAKCDLFSKRVVLLFAVTVICLAAARRILTLTRHRHSALHRRLQYTDCIHVALCIVEYSTENAVISTARGRSRTTGCCRRSGLLKAIHIL